VFDARRPPLAGGKPAYAPAPCPGAEAACAAAGGGPRLGARYLSCPAGPGCGKAHSQLEIDYHPVRGREGEGGDGGGNEKAGASEWKSRFMQGRTSA
jgi:hypothetical protein